MEFCQHIPVLHRKQEQGTPELQRVQCRRCAIGTEWEALDTNGTWNKWAALMVKESEAREKAVAASDGRHRTVEDATIAALKQKVNENDAAAVRWNAFCAKAGLSPTMSPNAAAERGENYKIHASIVSAMREHLTGQLNERRIHDLFVALRKATKAFMLNAVEGAPDEEIIVERAVKGAVSKVTVEMEKQAVDVLARLANRLNHTLDGFVSVRSTRPAPLVVKFLGTGGYDIQVHQAMEAGLVVGRAYEVLCGLVDRYSTRLILLGVPGDGFNSVMFDGVDVNHPCIHRLSK